MKLLLISALLSVGACFAKRSLWERLGGESKIVPMLDATVRLHETDPLTREYFGPHKFNNVGNHKYVVQQVVNFFSAGVGGPYKYSGKDMVEAHKGMHITETAFHALSYHLLTQMQEHETGTPEDHDEVLGILYSLKNDVFSQTNSTSTEFQKSENSGFLDGLLNSFNRFFSVQVPYYFSSLPLPRSTQDLKELTPDEIISLVPLFTLLAAPLVFWQFARKVDQATDLENNMSGIAQWSQAFYSGEGIIPAIPYLLGYVPGALAILSCYLGGKSSWIVFVAGYILVPIADLIIGEDSYNPTKEQEDKLKNNKWFIVVRLLYTPSYIATILYGAYVISTRPELTNFELAGMIVSVGIAGGFGIGCVHELIHRPTFAEFFSGVIATVFANYSHFWIEHLWGHHKRVATDEDPASSALGDDLYTFLIRDITKSFTDALQIEARFLKKKGKSILQHRILQGYAASALIAYGIYKYFGYAALIFYIGQGIVTALHIENANYIEHYGLRRRQIKGDKRDSEGEKIYERPGWFHAWDTGDRLTNWMLFKIQRHPDHHTNAGRPHQILRTFKQSPKMPTGYAGMFVLSWFPPLFFAIMNPLVKNAYNMRKKMEDAGIAASAFPKGSNNMSSWYKREGEGYFEKGSSPYEATDLADSHTERDVYETDFNSKFAKEAKTGGVVESTKLAQSVFTTYSKVDKKDK